MAIMNGGSGSDFLIGNVGESDEIRSGDGNDTIISGDRFFSGVNGNDTFYLGHDLIAFESNVANIAVGVGTHEARGQLGPRPQP